MTKFRPLVYNGLKINFKFKQSTCKVFTGDAIRYTLIVTAYSVILCTIDKIEQNNAVLNILEYYDFNLLDTCLICFTNRIHFYFGNCSCNLPTLSSSILILCIPKISVTFVLILIWALLRTFLVY